ncbi:Retrovirus-related Pol polyprotein from transposon 17.6, partial [Mucuna pruriens]
MDSTQINYTTIEKELLAIVFAMDKFRAYFLGSKVIVFSNHAALKYLLKKLDGKPRLIRWMLLQEFNVEIRDKKDAENTIANHLSRIQGRVDSIPIRDDFPNEQLLQIAQSQPLFAEICNFLVASTFLPGASKAYKAKIESEAKYYVWDDPYLWRFCNNQITRKYISDAEFLSVCHSTLERGPYGFSVPKALISDQGTHLCNRVISSLLEKYGKKVNPNRKDWSQLLEDALWAHRTTYQTPLGMSSYRIVFSKACHLPIEIEHRAY